MSLTKDDLLKDFNIQAPYILLQNNLVNIVISKFNDKYFLESFYNNSNIKGAARCALYLLLKKLLESKNITNKTILFIESLMPSDRDLPKLVKTYQEIGFNIVSGEIEEKNIIMSATIDHLIEILTLKCGSISGGKKKRKIRRRTMRIRSNKSRHSKRQIT
jgi:hypothetical protein